MNRNKIFGYFLVIILMVTYGISAYADPVSLCIVRGDCVHPYSGTDLAFDEMQGIFVDFGEIDMGVNNERNVALLLFDGLGDLTYWTGSWELKGKWVQTQSGNMNGADTPYFATVKIPGRGNLTPSNVQELIEGVFIQVYETSDKVLNPNKAGLTGRFYSMDYSGDPLDSLNEAVENMEHHQKENRVHAGNGPKIFPTIEFHKSGGITDAFGEDEDFVSGNVRLSCFD